MTFSYPHTSLQRPSDQKVKGTVSHFQSIQPSCAVTLQRIPSSFDGFHCMDYPLIEDINCQYSRCSLRPNLTCCFLKLIDTHQITIKKNNISGITA